MLRWIRNFLIIIGSLTLITMLTGVLIGIYAWKYPQSIKKNTILELNLADPLAEYLPNDPLARALQKKPLTLRDFIFTLEKAGKDEDVAGLVAKIGNVSMGFAQVQEIIAALDRFRQKNKFTIAYTDTFAELGSADKAYYLATGFDKIFLQPTGNLGLSGLIWESLFLKGTMDKLGLIPRMDHRKEYKNALNTLTEQKYTPPHREAIEGVIHSIFNQITARIAKIRGLEESVVRGYADQGILIASEAKKAGLVDQLLYQEQVYENIDPHKDHHFLAFTDYYQRCQTSAKGPVLALIFGVGEIQRGKNHYQPFSKSTIMGSDTVIEAFEDAINDPDVRAIIFRINSPGGSYIASDSIWRATTRASQAGKPVIVSMGDVAGSGGYFVAMSADKIVAAPSTVTGSIGVISGKMLTNGFWKKLGVSWDEVHTSANSNMWTGTKDYSPEQWQQMQTFLDIIYDDFTTKVAMGRGLKKETVLEIARGRIWTGQQAQKLGLVDELGGFWDAVNIAKESIGVSLESQVHLKVFPKEKELMEILAERLKQVSISNQGVSEFTHILQVLGPLLNNDYAGVLSMPYQLQPQLCLQ